MSYCAPVFRWVSSYTYQGLKGGISSRIPSPGLSAQTNQVPQAYLIVRGKINFEPISAELLPLESIEIPETPPPPASGDYTVKVFNSTGDLIEEISFGADRYAPDVLSQSFSIPVLDDPRIATIRLLTGDTTVLASVTASPNLPQVTITFPNGGETVSGTTITWTAGDADQDNLTYTVQYSSNGGASWQTLVVDWPGTSYTVPDGILAGSTQAMIRIIVSPNPPKDTDGRREGSGRGWVRELQGRWPGVLG